MKIKYISQSKISINSFSTKEPSRAGVELARKSGSSESLIIRVFLFGLHVVDPDPAFVPEEKGRDFARTGNGKLARDQVLQIAMTRLKREGPFLFHITSEFI